jgi:hypothetical protein
MTRTVPLPAALLLAVMLAPPGEAAARAEPRGGVLQNVPRLLPHRGVVLQHSQRLLRNPGSGLQNFRGELRGSRGEL